MITGNIRNRSTAAPARGLRDVTGGLTDKISDIVLSLRTPSWWWIGFALAFILLMVMVAVVTALFVWGVGIWGINTPVIWAMDITNFVFWIGIGHAGTLISAILLLMRQAWRTSLSRFAEAMTLFALACAALWPILHLGARGWRSGWLPTQTRWG